MMISVTSREFHFFVSNAPAFPRVIEWKKQSRHETQPFPDDLYAEFIDNLLRYCGGFDLLTVPAPSFHTYENYPIWELAKQVSNDINVPLACLFPEKSGKKSMGWASGIKKEVPKIDLEPGKFVLVIDDIATTRHTLRITSAAIMARHSFPCCFAVAGNIYGMKL